jgi:hypothetical protein
MQSTRSLAKQLAQDFPELHFVAGDVTMWDPLAGTIRYSPDGTLAELLHELGHGTLGHTDYRRDIALLGYERDAWKKAVSLAADYQIEINDEVIQNHLDTYRSWLHARSVCPACQLNGVQITDTTYRCIDCQTEWSVNEARTCALRRRTIK